MSFYLKSCEKCGIKKLTIGVTNIGPIPGESAVTLKCGGRL